MTDPVIRAAALAVELTSALEERRNAGVLWTRVAATDAHYLSADRRFDITVRAHKARFGAWCWLWDAYHDGQVVTPPSHQHFNARGAMLYAEQFMINHREDAVGPHCTYCGHRCFVYRVVPGGSWAGLMATCETGAANDRRQVDFDHTTAVNPTTLAQLMRLLYDVTALDKTGARRVLATLLRGLSAHPINPEQYESYARHLEETSRHDAADAVT